MIPMKDENGGSSLHIFQGWVSIRRWIFGSGSVESMGFWILEGAWDVDGVG